MAKRKRREYPKRSGAVHARPVPKDPADRTDESVSIQLRCPSCWGTNRGAACGDACKRWWWRKSGTLVKTGYSCDQCGNDWTVVRRVIDVIEEIDGVRYVEVDGELVPHSEVFPQDKQVPPQGIPR